MISILVPTRNNIDGLVKLFDSIESTVMYKWNVEVYLYIDDDDAETQTINIDHYGFKIVKYINTRLLRVGERLQELANNSRGDILMVAADDISFGSSGWDVEIEGRFDEYPDRILLVGSRSIVSEHCFLSRKSMEIADGFFSLPLYHFNVDTWLTKVFKDIDRYQVIKSKIIHKQRYDPPWDKKKKDFVSKDVQKYEQIAHGENGTIVHSDRLQSYIKEFEMQNTVTISRHNVVMAVIEENYDELQHPVTSYVDQETLDRADLIMTQDGFVIKSRYTGISH